MLNVMELCDSVSKSNVKCAKIFRQIVADGLGSSLTEAYQFHRDRRDYLRFVLRQFVLILADQPDILCQKIREVVAIVRIAREEVAWYFAHHEKMTATRNQLSVTDHRITELVELIVDLREIIENNWEYLLKDSIQLIQNVLSPNFRMKVSNTFQNCHGITESATQCLSSILESNDFHFETLRLNYIRLLVQFGLPKFKNINADAFIKLMNTILQRFQFADCLAQIMDELSLKFLFYYRPILQGVFEDIMRQQPNQMRSVAVYASIAKEFLRNARLYFPKEV
jgi:NCK-associated protein 1